MRLDSLFFSFFVLTLGHALPENPRLKRRGVHFFAVCVADCQDGWFTVRVKWTSS
jgi:hypothetical protein